MLNWLLVVLTISLLRKFCAFTVVPLYNNASACCAVPQNLVGFVVLVASIELRLIPSLIILNPTIVDFGINFSLLIIAIILLLAYKEIT